MEQMQLEIILDNKYNLLSKLGTGGTAEVLLGENRESKEKVAVKIIKDNNLINIFNKEIEMLKRIKSPNIINILDGGTGAITKNGVCSDSRCYLVLELATNGELFDFVFYPRSGFGESYGRFLFERIIEGIEAIHSAGVVHRDIKMENIMVDSAWNVKIADFGFATLIEGKQGNGILTTPLGTISYAAPEILRKQPYLGVPADIFSLGALLFTLVTGRMGFSRAIKNDAFYKHICKKDYANYWKSISANNKMAFSNEFKDLYTKLISYDPKERPSIEAIKSHPWMAQPKPTVEQMKIEFENRVAYVKKTPEVTVEQCEQSPNKVYRSFENEYFNRHIKCSKVKKDDLSLCLNKQRVINLKGINPSDFMNQLAFFFESKAKGNKTVTPNQDKAKLTVSYEVEEIEDSDIEIEIEPLELMFRLREVDALSKSYVLELKKNAGDKFNFYEAYDELLEFTQKI